MLSQTQAEILLIKSFPGVTPKAWTIYGNIYLYRVEHSSFEEKDFDPFFSVNPQTKEVKDFSVLIDGNISEISKLVWTQVNES